MYLTEDEAVHKRCPEIARAVAIYTSMVTVNGSCAAVPCGPIQVNMDKCIASECMAWRWYGSNPKGRVGYCGKAGKLE